VFTGIERVVNLPLPLARQIYYYFIESQLLLQEQQYKQMEQMLREGLYRVDEMIINNGSVML